LIDGAQLRAQTVRVEPQAIASEGIRLQISAPLSTYSS
jgi:hypothetical protein